MDFLKGFIGLKGVTAAPVSGRFVNELPGISTELTESIADREQETAAGVWQEIEDRTLRRLRNDLTKFVNSPARDWKQVITQTPGLTLENPAVLIEPGEEVTGITVKYPYGPFVAVFLRSVVFYSETEVLYTPAQPEVIADSEANPPVIGSPATEAIGGRVISIIDMATGETILQKTVGIKKGFNVVTFNQEINSPTEEINFFVGMDATGITFRQIRPEAFELGRGCRLEYAPGVYSQLGFADPTTPAIAVKLDIVCSLEKYIQTNIANFEDLLIYLAGAELLNEKLLTPRTGFLATKNIVRTEKVRDSFYSEYEDLIKARLKEIPLQHLCNHATPTQGIYRASLI